MYWVSVKPVKHKKHTRIANDPEFCHTAGPAQTFLATKRRPQTKARGAYRYSFYAFTVLCGYVKIRKVEVGLKFCPHTNLVHTQQAIKWFLICLDAASSRYGKSGVSKYCLMAIKMFSWNILCRFSGQYILHRLLMLLILIFLYNRTSTIRKIRSCLQGKLFVN